MEDLDVDDSAGITPVRRWPVLEVLLAVAGTLVTLGVAGWSVHAGLIVGGVLLAVWAWLVCDAPGDGT